MTDHREALEKIRQEFLEFEKTMADLYILKLVAEDLKNYREMMKLKKYD